MNTDIKEFVRRALEQGRDRREIAEALKAGQWEDDEIQEALSAFAEHPFPVPVPRKFSLSQPKEAFLYFVSFAGLYLSALSFGQLIFSFINRWFPDPLMAPYGMGPGFAGDLRMPVASLVVAFPLFLILTRSLLRSIDKDPERRRSLVGKWLTYATLAVAASVILGDLIAVLSSLLGGEITIRFLFKAFAVFLVAGSVFGFYLAFSRIDEAHMRSARGVRADRSLFLSRIFAWSVLLAVIAGVGYAVLLIGTPATQRAIAFDQRRLSDLQQISYVVNSYWETTSKLPRSIDELFVIPYFAGPTEDPETQLPYEYRATGEKTYELCATFAAASVSQYSQPKPVAAREDVWTHGAGRACFDREVFGKVRIQ